MQEEKMANVIHGIAQVSGIADEQMIRNAALKFTDEWGLSLAIVLEKLYFYLADGQEQRFIVGKFREYVTKEQEKLLEEFRIEIQQEGA